jgi:diaminopropionate ammonia-lyase family
VSRVRQERIESLGAKTERIAGTYDVAVHAASEAAARKGWIVVSDTSYEGYTEIPRQVMSGYTVMTAEILDLFPNFAGITHVVLQGGVGALAAAVIAHMWQVAGAARPIFIVVEPESANCLFESALAGKRVVVEGDLKTIMTGLSCGEPSLLAWEVLSSGVDFFATLPDSAIAPAMRAMAQGIDRDRPLIVGESGVVGVAFLRSIAADANLRRLLELDGQSRILVFGTEGDTDPELYRHLVGAGREQSHG